MKTAAAVLVLSILLTYGIFTPMAGGKTRGEKGHGEVHQYWENAEKHW